MNDTDPKIVRIARDLMMKKSPEERLKMGCSMFGFSKSLIESSLGKRKEREPSDFKKNLFLRLYGQEMDQETRSKIAAYFLESKNE